MFERIILLGFKMMFANYKYLLYLTIFSYFNFGAINALRILGIFPYQGKSQFIIPDEVMKALAAKGHQLDVYSHFPPEKPISNYTSFSLKGTVHEYVNNLHYDTMKGLSYAQLMEHMLSITGKPLCELLEHPHFQKLLRNPPTDPPYDIVVHSVIELRLKLFFRQNFTLPCHWSYIFVVLGLHGILPHRLGPLFESTSRRHRQYSRASVAVRFHGQSIQSRR